MNEEVNSTIKNHVPDKGISDITLRNLERYDEAELLARTGVPSDPAFTPRNYNEKVENRFEGLKLMYANQQHIISGHNMATIEKNCYNSWQRKYKEEEERLEHPFEDEDNDINELKAILDFLDECEQKVEQSIITQRFEDDFVIEKEHWDGSKRKELSKHFFNMFKELVDSYRAIYGVLIDNKIVTLGMGEDADKTEEEKEEELKRRILNA